MTDLVEETEERPVEVAKPAEDKLTVDSIKEERKKFYQELARSKKVFNTLLVRADDTEIDGKTLEEWRDTLNVKIPVNPTIGEIINLLSRINGLIYTVDHQSSRANLIKAMVKRELEEHRSKRFVSLKAKERTKPLSNEHIVFQLTHEFSSIENQLMFANYVAEFWEQKKHMLIGNRKLLEAIMFGLNTEARVANYAGNHDG